MLLVVFFVVTEVFVNIWLYYFYRCDFEDHKIFENINPETNRKLCLENIGYGFSKQEISWIPGTQVQQGMGGYDENLVHINSQEFRGPEVSVDKPENTYRIFSVGGSTTFGSGVMDNQTYPYFLQEMFDQSDLDIEVEVINAGWPFRSSGLETSIIKKRLLDFQPDLFMVFEPYNDIIQEIQGRPDRNAESWKERWIEICELEKKYHFDTIITIQPTVGAGKKILTEQELKRVVGTKHTKLLELYPSYVNQLKELANYCSKTADFRNIFDNISEPIYYDEVHTGEKGNQIIAKKFYQISLPLVLEREGIDFSNYNETDSFSGIDSRIISNDLELFSEKSIKILRDIFSPYKTPKVFSLIFN